MPFEPGHKLSKGRKPGSLNKTTQRLLDTLDAAGFDPFKEFLARYQGVTDDAKAAEILLKFFEYLVPKRTRVEGAIEIEDTSDAPRITLTQENIIQFIQAARDNTTK